MKKILETSPLFLKSLLLPVPFWGDTFSLLLNSVAMDFFFSELKECLRFRSLQFCPVFGYLQSWLSFMFGEIFIDTSGLHFLQNFNIWRTHDSVFTPNAGVKFAFLSVQKWAKQSTSHCLTSQRFYSN